MNLAWLIPRTTPRTTCRYMRMFVTAFKTASCFTRSGWRSERFLPKTLDCRGRVQMDLSELTPPELLALHAKLADELRTRGITRSANNPTGDLAEYLFCKAFGWNQAGNSHPNVDAIGTDGTRYQIKGRRITP